MNMKNEKMKFWSVLLSIALVISIAGGYVSKPVNTKADQFTTGQILMQENTSPEETAAQTESKVEDTTTGQGSEETTLIETGSTSEIETGSTSEIETTSGEATSEEQTTLEESSTPEESTTPEVTTEDPAAYTLIAHRGYSGYAPENSMPAFEKAVAAGFSMIELDVHRCKPDANGKATWVISHNDSLKSTMGVDVKISEHTYSEILQYSFTKGNNVELYPNLKIASLEEVIALIKDCKSRGQKIKWQIELKESDDDNFKDYFQQELVKPIKDAQVEDCVVFSSFHYTYLRKIKEIDDSLHTWFLSTVLTDTAIDEYAVKCKADGISFKGTATTTTKAMIEKALSKGFKLGTYTIDSTPVMGVYYAWGVRQFATDALSPMDVGLNMLTGKYNVKVFTCTLEKDSYTYDGTRKLPKVKVEYKGAELVEGLNYSLSYGNNKNPGTASVYISGLNNCIDEYKLTYKIVMPKVTGFQVTANKASSITLSWTKVDNVTGYIVQRYNYTTKKYEAIKTIANPNTVTYKATKLSSAAKYRYRVRTYLISDSKTYKSTACTAKTTYTKPAKTSTVKLERYKNSKRLRVKWTAQARCTGYQVVIATNKKMTKNKKTYTVKGTTAKKLKIKKLQKNKTYYVKVRAYLTVGSKTYYGAYSTVMKSKKAKKSKK